MSKTLISLIELTDTLEARVLGRTSDPDLVAAVRERLAADARRSLSRLAAPVRPVPTETAAE